MFITLNFDSGRMPLITGAFRTHPDSQHRNYQSKENIDPALIKSHFPLEVIFYLFFSINLFETPAQNSYVAGKQLF